MLRLDQRSGEFGEVWLQRIGVAAAGLMFLVPFLVPAKALPIPSFWAETLAVTLGLLALSPLIPATPRLEWPRVAWLPMAFAAVIAVQAAWGPLGYPQQGVLAALLLCWATGLVLLGGLLRREVGLEASVSVLAWFVFAGGLLSALIGLMQQLDSFPLPRAWVAAAGGRRVWANLGQPNHLANYLTAGLVSIGFLYGTRKLRPVYVLGAALLLTYILRLTGSRAPLLYLFGLLALSFVFWRLAREDSNRRLLLFSLVAFATFLALPYAVRGLFSALNWTGLPLAIRMSPAHFAADERPGLALAAWRMFTGEPLFGVGFRRYAIHYFQDDDLPLPRVLGFNDHAHNIVLQVMAEFGVVGLLALLAGVLPWLAGLARQPRSPALWWMIAFCGITGIHSLVEYPLWYAYFLGPTALVLGLGEARTLSFALWPSARLSWSFVAAAVLLAGWLITARTVRDYVPLENFLAFRYRYLHASQELGPKAGTALGEIARTSLLYPYVDLGRARIIHIGADALDDKLAVNGRALEAFPIDDLAFRQAMLLALAGDLLAAQRQWDRAAAQHPRFERDALLVLQRRVEDGLAALVPLEQHAAQRH